MTLNIITHNPYRLIGVFPTSTKKELVANIARIKANIRVNRTVSFPTDLEVFLGRPERTLDDIVNAESKLALPADSIRYAQFWLISTNELDTIAINNLVAGAYDKALSIWEKKESVSSIHNRVVVYLLKENYDKALDLAHTFYEEYKKEFVELVLGPNSEVVSSNNLGHDFLDVLCEDVDASEILQYITNKDWKEYLVNKITTSIVESIEHHINVAKQTKGKDCNACLKAGTKLMIDTLPLLQNLKNELSQSDPKYQIIADKLGLEILRCSIDYYNGSTDDEAAYKVLKLQKYALSIVTGKIAKDRCEKNLRILEETISQLPPIEVMPEHKDIQSCLNEFAINPELIRFAIKLIKDCVPYVVSIKEKLGVNHRYYRKISTTLVNSALGNVISEVNKAQDKDFETLKSTLIEAWRTQLYMDKFDLEQDFKEGRYKPCREALYRIIDECKGFEDVHRSFLYRYGSGWCNDIDVTDVDLQTDEEFYASCGDLESLSVYIKRFPSGKHADEIRKQIEELRFNGCKSVYDFQAFIKDFPASKFIIKAHQAIDRLIREENERKARQARQEKELAACHSIDDVVDLYIKEGSDKIDADRCSLRAYDLATTESDYRKVLSAFGEHTSGGQKAKSEIEERREIKEERKSNIRKWSIRLIITVGILGLMYLIWGFSGLRLVCYIFTGIFTLLALCGIGSKEELGCLLGIIAAAFIAFGLSKLVSYLDDTPQDQESDTAEYVQKEDKNDYLAYPDSRTNNTLPVSTTTDDYASESKDSQTDIDDKTYIDNQLETGAKPYKNYYRSRTGDNYLDFKTSGNDYVIIVKDYSTSKVVNHVYVRAGDKGRLYLPNGTYNIYFYGGRGWNPNKKKGHVTGGFVTDSPIQKDGPVELYNQYGEYTLYPVQNGNLQLQSATVDEAL